MVAWREVLEEAWKEEEKEKATSVVAHTTTLPPTFTRNLHVQPQQLCFTPRVIALSPCTTSLAKRTSLHQRAATTLTKPSHTHTHTSPSTCHSHEAQHPQHLSRASKEACPCRCCAAARSASSFPRPSPSSSSFPRLPARRASPPTAAATAVPVAVSSR